MTDNGQINALERLAKLRDSGNLTPEEYQREKAKLLSGSSGVPFYRKLWFVVTLTCLLITFPVSLLILITGDVYKKSKSESLQPISTRARYVYAGALVLWIVALVIRAALNPQSIEQAWNSNAVDESQATETKAVAETPKQPIACDSTEAADEVKDALENSATSGLVQIKVEDFGNAQELYFAKRSNARVCQADAVLNTGATTISYEIFFGPSGKQMVQVKQGVDAFDVDIIKALEATAAAHDKQQKLAAQDVSPPASPANAPQGQAPDPDQGVPAESTVRPANPADAIESHYSDAYRQCESKLDGDNWSRAGADDCTESELKVQVAKLNDVYVSMKASLDPEGQAKLRDSESTWIKSLQSECTNGNSSADTGNAAELSEPECELDMTVRRRLQLEQMQAVGNR